VRPAFLKYGDSIGGAALKISERREKSLTGSSHAGRMVNPTSRQLAGCWHWFTKAREIQQNWYRVESRSLWSFARGKMVGR
jgi:poly(3-hydroxyalkanoate) synthetase